MKKILYVVDIVNDRVFFEGCEKYDMFEAMD